MREYNSVIVSASRVSKSKDLNGYRVGSGLQPICYGMNRDLQKAGLRMVSTMVSCFDNVNMLILYSTLQQEMYQYKY